VDDEEDLVRLVSFGLQKDGFDTLEACGGTEAWCQIETHRPGLLILDLMMPDLDGWELCRRVREDQRREIREIGILILTARTAEEDKIRGLQLGADDYLTKPFSVHELALRVTKIAEKKKVIRGLHQEIDHLRGRMHATEKNLQRVVHDLKTPMIAMGAMAKLLLNKGDRAERLTFLRNIYEGSQQLTAWIEDILKFYALPSERQEKDAHELDIDSLIGKVIRLKQGLAETKKIDLTFFPSGSHLIAYGNENLLQRALDNLVSNALKYTPVHGKVEIRVIPYCRKGNMEIGEISVSDTGVGIAPEDLSKIFEPFYRGKNATGEGGVGLGLALVKEVVELHGGKILVESEIGKGSMFSVLLPLERQSWEKEVNPRCDRNDKQL
jgi:signal transduction histidine kinase